MPNCAVPIQLTFNNHVVDVHSVQVKLDGLVVDMTSADLLLLKSETHDQIAGASMVMRFMLKTHMSPIGGSEFKVRLVTAFRVSLHKFHVYLAFQSLGKRELGKLRNFITELP